MSRKVYFPEEMKQFISRTVDKGGTQSGLFVMKEIKGDDLYTFTMSLFMMALHLEMYDEAQALLEKMSEKNMGKELTGEFEITYYLTKGSNYGTYKNKQFIGVETLILSQDNIPPLLLKTIWEKYAMRQMAGELARNKYYSIELLYNCYHNEEWYCKTLDFQFILAERFHNIFKSCPEMPAWIVEGCEPHFLSPERLMNLNFGNINTAKDYLTKYCQYLKYICECFSGSPRILETVFSKAFFSTLYSHFGKHEIEEFIVRYKPELKDILKTETEYYQKVITGSDSDQNAETSFWIFFNEIVSLYVIWTNRRTNDNYSAEARKAAYELSAAVVPVWKEIISKYHLHYLMTFCEHVDSDEGATVTKADAVNALACIMKNVGRVKLVMDMRDERVRRIFDELYYEAGISKDSHNMLTEFMEMIEPVQGLKDITGLNGSLISDSEDSAEKDTVLTIDRIIRNLIKTGNPELVEITLRKNLIPAALYPEVIERLVNEAPKLLPCLIAYRQARDIREDVRL